MSHSKERSEKVCLNCQAEVYGRYCHVCGQENVEPKETFWGLITHFFYDITHFDGKFFSTLKYLVTKPGFLSAEYVRGRRASYLNPIRMYIFTSAFFFIIFFSVTDLSNNFAPKNSKNTEINLREARSHILQYADSKEDSLDIDKVFLMPPDKSNRRDTTKGEDVVIIGYDGDTARRKKSKRGLSLSPSKYDTLTIAQYDSVQKTLPADKRDGWLLRMINKRRIVLRDKYGDDDEVFLKAWLNTLFHQFPKLLFVSLPIFALILRLLYIRRKQFYYVDHGIFSFHIYIFSFILLLVSIGIGALDDALGWKIFIWLQIALWVYYFYYNYKAMRNFYRQRRGKTIVKFLLLNFLALISIIFLFSIFSVLSIFQM